MITKTSLKMESGGRSKVSGEFFVGVVVGNASDDSA